MSFQHPHCQCPVLHGKELSALDRPTTHREALPELAFFLFFPLLKLVAICLIVAYQISDLTDAASPLQVLSVPSDFIELIVIKRQFLKSIIVKSSQAKFFLTSPSSHSFKKTNLSPTHVYEMPHLEVTAEIVQQSLKWASPTHFCV